jgi:uncharacterized protein (DUF983 family)
MTLWTVISRSLRLRCPSCGMDKVLYGLLGVKETCALCGFNCRPEGGYYLGAIYINYAVTAIIGLVVGLSFAVADRITLGIIVASAVAIFVGVAFFQPSRSLWLGIGFWNGWHGR